MVQDTLLGFPAHTLHPQGVCSIRKAAQPLTAALPYRRGEFATLLTVSRPARITEPLPVKRTVKKYKVFPADSHVLLAAFYAARASSCFSIGVNTPRLRCTRLVL